MKELNTVAIICYIGSLGFLVAGFIQYLMGASALQTTLVSYGLYVLGSEVRVNVVKNLHGGKKE